MDKYRELIKIGLKKILIYKGFILITIFKNLIYIFLQYSLWKAVKENSEIPINLNNIIIYFLSIRAIGSINYNLSQTMSYDVKRGNIISILVKPLEIHKYYFFEILGNTIGKFFTVSLFNILIIIYMLGKIEIIYLLQLFLLIMGAYLLNFVIELIFGTISFFTQSIWGIETLKSICILILSGSFFPIYYYPKWFVGIMEYVPFPYIYGKVAQFIVSGKNFLNIFVLQIIFTIIIYIFYKYIINKCLRKISVNGG